jgi:hypothetical protein
MPDPSMNNDLISNKRILMIATMLSAMMLAASTMPSLVPTTAFAQQSVASGINANVDEILSQQPNPGSAATEDEPETSDGDDAGASAATEDEPETSAATEDEPETSDGDTSEVTPVNSGINLDSDSEEDTTPVNEEDSVTVDPVVQSAVQSDLNVNVDTAVVMDEEDCDEASNEVVQANGQESDQQAATEGRVGDNSMYVGPKMQLSEQVALNANVDIDVVLVDGCKPVDDITQVNAQSSDQGTSSDLESSPSGTAIFPANQRADKFAYNIGVEKDFVL